MFEALFSNPSGPDVDEEVVPPLLRAWTFRARELRRRGTAAERALWQLLRGRQLGAKFRRQQPLGPYFVDFFCEKAGLVLEVDGARHFPRPPQDVVREAFLRAAGLTVLRFANAEVLTHPERVIRRIRACLRPLSLRERGWGEGRSL